MSRRREVMAHRGQLLEIREIMNSMKNLAYFETRKLARYINSQQQVVSHIETTASDLLLHHPGLKPQPDHGQRVFLLLGSERGFCGDFNSAVQAAMEEHLTVANTDSPLLLVVGNKLQQRLEDDPRVTASLAGANVAEEIGPVLNRVIETLVDLQARYPGLRLQVFYQDPLRRQVINKTILPPFIDLTTPAITDTGPPFIQLSPAELLHELIEHYLFAVLYGINYAALMAENQARIEHLDNAIQRLDEKTAELSRKTNAMRQEEIIEEIEVILLNAAPTIKR